MHGVKNDPGLIPTERELKLTVQTIEGSDQKEDVKKLSSSIRTKIRSKSLKPKSLNNKSDDLNSVCLSLDNFLKNQFFNHGSIQGWSNNREYN